MGNKREKDQDVTLSQVRAFEQVEETGRHRAAHKEEVGKDRVLLH